MLCRDRCGYCTFAKPPARLEAPFLTPEQVLAIARRRGGRVSRGALHPGRGARGQVPAGRELAHGTRLRVDGRLSRRDVRAGGRRDRSAAPRQRRRADARGARATAPVVAVAGNDDRDARRAPRRTRRSASRPDKTPERRLATLEAAGLARVPFTTGILVGIGETRAERLEALTRSPRVTNVTVTCRR